MNKRITLNWQHDLDLIGLNVHPDFELGKMMKRAIIACAKGDTGFRIPLPRPMPYPANCNNMQVNISFAPGVDDEAIQFINGFRYGYQVNAMKQIFRMYLEGPYLEPYYNEKMFNVKARGKKRARATHGVIPVATPSERRLFVKPPVSSIPISYAPSAPTSLSAEDVPAVEQQVKKESVTNVKVPDISVANNVSVSAQPVDDVVVETVEVLTDSSADGEEGFDLFGAINDMMN